MYLSILLHIYQPENQYPDILDQIVNESYRPIFKFLLANPHIKITFNINAVLVELWDKYDYKDLIDSVKKLLDRGQIELLESARYHAFLPLIPESEVVRQIKLNHETNKKYFGEFYKPKGFFGPEMSYSPKIASVLNELGYEYVMADEIAYNGKLGSVDFSKIYKIKGTNLKIFFRNKRISNIVMGAVVRDVEEFVNILKKELLTDQNKIINDPFDYAQGGQLSIINRYTIAAMDGETFGHHRKGLELFLFDLLKSKEIETVKIGDIPNYVKDTQEISPVSSTWATSEKELSEGVPFDLWFDKGNEIHRKQWELTDLCIETVQNSKFKVEAIINDQLSILNQVSNDQIINNKEKKIWVEARLLLDSALHSCHYWWASAKPWWSLEMIEQGAFKMWKVVEKVPDATEMQKDKAYKLYQEIIMLAFSWQRTGYVRRISEQEKSWRKIPFKKRANTGEYEALLDLLKKSEIKASLKEEYEQAIRWRDARHKLINELDVYDAVHIIDQLRASVDFSEYDKLVKEYAKDLNTINPGQPEK